MWRHCDEKCVLSSCHTDELLSHPYEIALIPAHVTRMTDYIFFITMTLYEHNPVSYHRWHKCFFPVVLLLGNKKNLKLHVLTLFSGIHRSVSVLSGITSYGWVNNPDSQVHGANMGPTWVLSAPDGPRVGPMNLAIMKVIRMRQQLCMSIMLLSHDLETHPYDINIIV